MQNTKTLFNYELNLSKFPKILICKKGDLPWQGIFLKGCKLINLPAVKNYKANWIDWSIT